ncbi:MAG: phosphoribosyl-ATP diphosphatase [Anaeromicrobium sp.]|jgi:phosphoribosyl-ATP pyrophosphohydrolase|uniref:phosphoribosyl-ATP diphosphatase n=1 Tax=Anaeromicrobium sp. TaxID=1929132 RepID=UPI0025E2E946|nr:phosphoribosyl-ATP diphosphatase [Anaeromicrobium sp.]MCT4593889.1 phosphoribosyl-ATP diphosphatase [Anaeromicrobium sp.]
MENNILKGLYETIENRRDNPKEGSYTSYLFEKGIDKILKKVGEECTETIIEASKGNRDNLKEEIGDLVYHLMVLMVQMDVDLDHIGNILAIRHKIQNNKKPERKEIEKW